MSLENAPRADEALAIDLERELTLWASESDENARRLWGSLVNRDWTHGEYGTISYSFRVAAGWVDDITRSRYDDVYATEFVGVEDPHVAEVLARFGWTSQEIR